MAGKAGAKGVYIDEALNVVYPVGVTEDNPLVVYMAHSDVVFPATEPLPLKVEDGKIKCPGVVIGKGAHTREEYGEISCLFPSIHPYADADPLAGE